MGSLNLPSAWKIYVDTSIFIYSVEKHAVYAPLLVSLWQAVQTGAIDVVSSELAYLETLVVPKRASDTALINDYDGLFAQSGIYLEPITRPILKDAAHLRATIPALRTPDALHAATARLIGCQKFLTNDPGFQRTPNLPVEVLDDLL